ncbi:MAG TPA: DUF4388 domain-containing protein [Kofleriaceae bacterium]|nr:DUF4388 domain-containing protein [Kofleriaceae bacterium]
MSLIGNLADVAVVDLMQFVHLGARTGTLVLERDNERAHISFQRGRIVGAYGPTSPSVCELLVLKGDLLQSELDAVLAEHAKASPKVPLGQLLVAKGAVSADALREAITHKVERTVFDLIGWTFGTFRFELDEVRGDQEIALAPGDVIPQLDINTEMVLIEALRLFDERNRSGEIAPALPPPPAVAAPTRAPLTVQLVTEDIELVARVGAHLAPGISVRTVELRDAGAPAPGEPPPLVLVDARRNVKPAAIDRVRKRHPRSLVVAIIAPATDPRELYAIGVAAVVPADGAAIAACCVTLFGARGTTNDGAPTETRSSIARLRRVIADLRGGLVSATLSLNLMTIVADSVDRAILFLVQRDMMIALGAFGQHGNGQPLVESTQGMCVPIGSSGALSSCVAEGRACTVEYDGPDFPTDLRHIIDRPRSGQAVLFPVLGSRRVIALIYADNGKHLRSVDDVEIVEIATAQVGLAFENELLRRQLDRSAYAAH